MKNNENIHQNFGNFKTILHCISKYDLQLRNHLEEGGKNAQYTSPEVQNELIQIFSKIVRSQIMVEINDALCFEISFDEIPDISGKEQMVISIRYVRADGKVVERFMGFYDAYEIARKVSNSPELRLDGQTKAKIVTRIISQFNINHEKKCISISTDGAPSLSGKFTGAVKLMQETQFKNAVWVYCSFVYDKNN